MRNEVPASNAPHGKSGTTPATRGALWFLTVSALVVGLWAQAAPRSFYSDFPGIRRFWISLDGPYNEHLIRDVGGLNLSLAALTMAAAGLGSRGLAQLAATCWLIYGLPHLGYHLTHLEPFEALDVVAQVGALATQVVAPMWVLAASFVDRWHSEEHRAVPTRPDV